MPGIGQLCRRRKPRRRPPRLRGRLGANPGGADLRRAGQEDRVARPRRGRQPAQTRAQQLVWSCWSRGWSKPSRSQRRSASTRTYFWTRSDGVELCDQQGSCDAERRPKSYSVRLLRGTHRGLPVTLAASLYPLPIRSFPAARQQLTLPQPMAQRPPTARNQHRTQWCDTQRPVSAFCVVQGVPVELIKAAHGHARRPSLSPIGICMCSESRFSRHASSGLAPKSTPASCYSLALVRAGVKLSLNPWMGDFAWSSTRLP